MVILCALVNECGGRQHLCFVVRVLDGDFYFYFCFYYIAVGRVFAAILKGVLIFFLGAVQR